MKWESWGLGIGVVAVVGGLIAYNQLGGEKSIAEILQFDEPDIGDDDEALGMKLMPDRTLACGALKGEPMERLQACLAEMGQSKLSKGARSVLTDVLQDGKLLVAARVESLQGDVIDLSKDESLRELLMGSDEAAAAAGLRDRGVRGLAVSRDVMQALDRDSRVLARLGHHSFLEWFQLRYVTEDLYIYTVRTSDSRISAKTGDELLKGLRARIFSQPVPRQAWKPNSVRLMASMRTQGSTLVTRHAVGDSLERVLDELSDKLVREWEREIEIRGHGSLEDRAKDIRLEVHVVMERAPVEPRTRYQIFDIWELGVDGMMFRHRDGVENEKFTYVPGSEAVLNSYKSGDQFLRNAVKQGGWTDSRPWEDRSTQLDVIRTEHFMERYPGGEGLGVRLIRGLPEVPLEYVNARTTRQMLIDGGDWWLNNQLADGSFEYKYWPDQNRRSTEYNEVRHILGTRDLADVYRFRADPKYLAGSQRSMDWLLKYAVHSTEAPAGGFPNPVAGSMLFRYPSIAEGKRTGKVPNQKLGTVAVGLLGWIAWAKASGSHDQDANIREMAKYVLSQLNDSGKFEAYNVPKGHSYFGAKNDIVPGEAALSLGEVAEYFEEPQWLEFYPKFLDFYEPWFRERAVRTNPYGRWPHDTYDNLTRLDLVQFGPWAVMASKQYYRMTGDERAAAFGLEIADWMIDSYQWTGARSPWPDYVGGYYKMPNELPAMQTFCYSEGTAAAYHIASKYRPDGAHKYELATRESIRFLEVMQYDEIDSYYLARPGKVFGGVKYAMNENKIRTDYVGHGMSTLSQYLDTMEYDPAVTVDLPAPDEVVPRAANPVDLQKY